MAKKLNLRFYKRVGVEKNDDGFVIKLDQYVLKTPDQKPADKRILLLPTQKAAELVAAEWDAQGDEVDPRTMPVTRLLNVAIARTPEARDELISEAQKYAGSDLLCYRSAETRLYLEHQIENWDPVLDWAAKQGVVLKTTEGLEVIAQDPAALEVVGDYARGLDDIALTLFVHLLSTFGSTVLAMAVMEGYLSPEEGFAKSRLDELWQIKYWGQDEFAQERTDAIAQEITALCRLLDFYRTSYGPGYC